MTRECIMASQNYGKFKSPWRVGQFCSLQQFWSITNFKWVYMGNFILKRIYSTGIMLESTIWRSVGMSLFCNMTETKTCFQPFKAALDVNCSVTLWDNSGIEMHVSNFICANKIKQLAQWKTNNHDSLQKADSLFWENREIGSYYRNETCRIVADIYCVKQ